MASTMDGRPAVTRLVLAAVGFTLLWLLVLHLAANLLPLAETTWLANLRGALVNLLALVVPLIVILRLGWWGRTALTPRRPNRSWLVLVPLLALAVGYAYGGLSGSASTLASSALLFLALGANEEVMFRGLIQGVFHPLSPWARCVAVASVFGLQHIANLLFGNGLYETMTQVLSAACFGFAYAAARIRIDTVWPLALLHGLVDFCNTHAATPFPPAVHLAYAAVYVGLASWLLTTLTSTSAGRANAGTALSR